jgi:hypothetical protein
MFASQQKPITLPSDPDIFTSNILVHKIYYLYLSQYFNKRTHMSLHYIHSSLGKKETNEYSVRIKVNTAVTGTFVFTYPDQQSNFSPRFRMSN